MNNTVKALEINEEYLLKHRAVPFTLNKKTTGTYIYSWNTAPRFYPEDMKDSLVRIRYLFDNIKKVGLDDLAMPDQPKEDSLLEECHEITFDEISSYFESEIYKKQGTIWNIDKPYNAIFQTQETHDKIKEKYGKSISLVYPCADCAVVRFYDSKKQIVGLTHSDAVHTTSNIIGQCIVYMQKHFDSNLEDIEVFVGNFAKDGWKYDRIPDFAYNDTKTGLNDSWKDYIKQEGDNYIINYGDKIYDQIKESGINTDNIYYDPSNTLFDDDYFSNSRSYNSRVEGKPTYREGRNLMGITFDSDKLVEDASKNDVILR